MVLIIYHGYQRMPSYKSRMHLLLLTGLIISMFADALIELTFVLGLATFLIGHLCYAGGFLERWTFSWLRLGTVIPLALYASWYSTTLVEALQLNNHDALILPVIAYVIVISFMLLTSIMTGNKWAAIGSFLFVISDSILAWNMFVSTIPHGSDWVMCTYYSAQLFIAHSIGTFSHRTAQ